MRDLRIGKHKFIDSFGADPVMVRCVKAEGKGAYGMTAGTALIPDQYFAPVNKGIIDDALPCRDGLITLQRDQVRHQQLHILVRHTQVGHGGFRPVLFGILNPGVEPFRIHFFSESRQVGTELLILAVNGMAAKTAQVFQLLQSLVSQIPDVEHCSCRGTCCCRFAQGKEIGGHRLDLIIGQFKIWHHGSGQVFPGLFEPVAGPGWSGLGRHLGQHRAN